jgi:uncharacterized protein (TIGR02996 family)
MPAAERAALFQAILDDPQDDDRRLVYADWLEENGEGDRADFIRTQIELATLPAYHPRRRELEVRAKDLVEAHGDRWRAEVSADLDARSAVFRRGFVAELTLPAVDFLTDGAALLDSAPLECLRLRGASGCAEHLARVPGLARVRELGLGDCDLNAAAVRALASSPHLADLRALDVRLNYLGDEGASALASWRLDELRSLSLGLNRISVAGVEALLTAPTLPRLEELDLSNFAPEGCREFTQSMSGVWARCNEIDPDLARLLAEAPTSARLRALRLYTFYQQGGGIGPEGAGLLARSPRLANLIELEVGDNLLGYEGVRALASSPHLAGLRVLGLSENFCGEEGARALASSPYLRGLTDLVLAANDLGDEGLAALAESPNFANLARLDLTWCDVTSAGARALAESPSLGSLVQVVLDPVALHDEDVEGLLRRRFGQGLLSG